MKYLLILPLLLLDLLLLASSLILFGLPYIFLIEDGKAPLVLRLWK